MTLPLARYFDDKLLQQEQRGLLDGPLCYAGHERWLPNDGDYACLPFDECLVLINDNGSPTLLDNVCAHRQAVLLEGTGHLRQSITCPIHSWNYRFDGSLRHA